MGERDLRSQTKRKGRNSSQAGRGTQSTDQDPAIQAKNGFLVTRVKHQKFMVLCRAGAPGTEPLGQRSQAAPDSHDWLGVSKPQARSSWPVTEFVTEPRFVKPDTRQTQARRHRRLSKKRVYSRCEPEGRCRERASNLPPRRRVRDIERPTNKTRCAAVPAGLLTRGVTIFT